MTVRRRVVVISLVGFVVLLAGVALVLATNGPRKEVWTDPPPPMDTIRNYAIDLDARDVPGGRPIGGMFHLLDDGTPFGERGLVALVLSRPWAKTALDTVGLGARISNLKTNGVYVPTTDTVTIEGKTWHKWVLSSAPELNWRER